MSREQPRVAAVTGTSSGFGLLTAITLARRGWQVIASMRQLDKQGELLRVAAEAGVSNRIETVTLDVTDFDHIDTTVAGWVDQFGRIDALINNAGVAIGGFVEELDLTDWRQQFDTNVFGLIALTRAVLPHMRERRSGLIVNVSSISGRIGFPGLSPYVASKFAVEGFSESLRLEMAPYGVRVVLVEPASYRTNVWQTGLEANRIDPATSAYKVEAAAMIRAVQGMAKDGGDPEEVADLIARIADTPKPALRYPIGRGSRFLLGAKRWLPWRMIERTVARRLRS